jgi:hypothetical protein
MIKSFSVVALLALAGSAHAQVIDGSLDPSYGPAIVLQTVDTQFGNANPPGATNGSELNAAYARISGGRLYVMLTGNHEPNFNKLDIFIDNGSGSGENTLSGTPGYDNFSGSSWNSANLNGLTFDTGFKATHHLFTRWGGNTAGYEADFVARNGGTSAQVPGSKGVTPNASGLTASGFIPAGNIGTNASATALTQDLFFAINNNNAAGVGGGTGAADPLAAAAVTTGIEFSIDLADLGATLDGTVIKIAAMINNGDHNYLSNQVLGGLPAGTGNLGGNGTGGFTGNLSGVNFNSFAGEQFFTIVVPAPASAALLGLGGLVAARRRRA